MKNKMITLEKEYLIKGIVESLDSCWAGEGINFDFYKGTIEARREILIHALGSVVTSDAFELFLLTLDIAYSKLDIEIMDYISNLDKPEEQKEEMIELYSKMFETDTLQASIEKRLSGL